MKSLRDDYDSCEEEAKMLTDNHMYKDRCGPKRKRFLQEGIENEDNWRLTARDKFRVDTFAVILDSLSAELERRKQDYAGFHERFQVFLQLRWLSSDKIRHLAANLQKAYSSVSEDFPDEMVRFSGHLNQMDENVSTPEKFCVISESQGRIKGGQRGQLPLAPRCKGAPRDEMYFFKLSTRLKNVVIQKRYKNTTLYYIRICCVKYQGDKGPQQQLIYL